VKGSNPTESGFQLLPMILGLMISSIASGQLISRTGKYKIFPILGTAFMSLGFLVLTTLKADTNYWILAGGMLLVGLGLGQMMQTLTIASQNAVGPRDIGVATSSSTFFRQVGGTLGVAVIFSVVFSVIGDKISTAFASPAGTAAIKAASTPSIAGAKNNAAIMKTIYDPLLKSLASGKKPGAGATSSLDGDTSFLNNASHVLKAPFLTGFSEAMVVGFWVSLAVIIVAFILAWFLKATPLRVKSAIQEVADQDEAIQATRAANTLSTGLAPDLDTGRIRVVADEEEPETVGKK
jgi:MFS family permease